MMIKHDSQGFLIGELIDATGQLVDGQARGLDMLARMDRNLATLAGAGRRGSSGARGGSVVTAAGSPAGSVRALEPAGRAGANPNRVSASDGSMTKAVAQAVANETARAVARTQAARAASISQVRRDAGGRFVKGAGSKPGSAASNGGDSGGGGGGGGGGILSTAAGNIRDTAGNAANGIDPTVNALGELKDVMEPLGRGWRMAFGRAGEQKKERWYKRFLKALERKPGDKSVTNVVAGGGGGGGIMGGLLGGLVGPAMGMLGKGGKGLMGLLKRVPVLGALMAGGGVLTSMLGGGSRDEKYRGVGQSIGAGAGMFAGAALGSVFGLPGTIAGGYLGTMLGEKVGEAMGTWTKALVDADIPGQVVSLAGQAWGKVAGVASAANDAIKQATGVDIGASAASAARATKQAAVAAVDAGKQVAAKVAESAPHFVPDAFKRMGRAGMLMTEAVSSGITSPSKLANFMGQMSHESSGFTRTEEGFGYKSAGRLRAVFGRYFKSDSEANAAIAAGPEAIANRVYGGRMGNNAAGDGFKYRGRGFVQLTGRDNYAAAGRALGIDLVNNPDLAADPVIASKIAVWYWNKNVAGRGKDGSIESATRAINGGLNGLDDRRAQAAKFGAVIAKSGMPSVNAPSIPSTVAKIPSPIDVPASAGSAGTGPSKPTVIVAGEVGQNVSDRGIAHKVTGGMGAS